MMQDEGSSNHEDERADDAQDEPKKEVVVPDLPAYLQQQ